MKLLIAADIFPPQSGGPATYVVNLANALTKDGWKVRIVTHNTRAEKKKVDCKVYSVWFKNKLLRYINYFILLFIYSFGTDVMYAMGPVNAGWPALIVSKLLGKKFVVKVVGDYAWEQGQVLRLIKDGIDIFQQKEYGGKVGHLKKIERLIVKKADKVIVPSQYLKKIVVGWGADEKKVELVYNNVDFEVAKPIEHEGEKWLVSVGRLVPWKGFDTLIEVMPDLLKESPSFKLKIIGDGPEFNNLKFKIQNSKLEEKVELLGSLSHRRTLSYINSADVFILNSGYEGLPHVVIEAHNQGVPVLASKVGGNPEVVNGDNLFEYNNKKEIKEKVLRLSFESKSKSIPHRFFYDMIDATKETLEETYKYQ